MSAALKVASARQQSRPPTKGRARVLERRLLANPRLAYQYSVLPLAVRPVLMAAIELVVLHGDGEAHYAPDLAAGDERTLAEVLAWRMNAPLAAAEIGRLLEALAQAGLLALGGGGLRLGAIYAKGRANTSPSLGGTSELKRLTAIENGKRGGRPPEAAKAARQVTMLLPIGGGLDGALAAAAPTSGSVLRSAPGAAEASPGAPDGTHAEPTVGYSGTQTGTQTEPTVGFPETQSGTQTGGVGFSVGFPSPAQREYPVAAAALEETNNFNSLAAAAAAIPGAGANARGETQETQETQTETQTEPTAGLSGLPADPSKPGPSPDAVALGEAMARQFHFTAEHRDEAPGCMQGYLDAGYDAGQIRAVLEAKRGRKASSARMLQKALAAQFPEVSY